MLGNRKSQHSFAQIPSVHMARSQFDRSFAIKDTFDFDYLVPIFVDEILPGDTANVTLATFGRLATPLKPVMDNMYLDFFFFFVPSRLVWDNWEKFNGAQDNPGDSTDYILPAVTAHTYVVGDLGDKMGLPTSTPSPLKVNNALPMRAYNLIWNEWFRDQNMLNSLPVPKGDGPDDFTTNYNLQKRGKRHDYFTSALPWPQKGPSVQIPLGTTANIIPSAPNVGPTFRAHGTAFVSSLGTATGDQKAYFSTGVAPTASPLDWEAPHLVADLSAATAATINQLREAFMMQSLFELDARGGTRYVEILLAHFNVQSPDFRLQRPEYLGGGNTKINSHPVAQTAPSESGDTPQGNLAAFSTFQSGGSIGFSKSFVEHGYVIGLACARADLTYQQGINRLWNRKTRYDFFWPKLQELGEQAIYEKELYATGVDATDNLVFGYQERYAEYRYKPSEIHGQFRSNYTDSLDVWHLAQDFDGVSPVLGPGFIQSSTPIKRVLAVPSQPDLLFDGWFQYKHARPMATYSVPATLGRF